MSLLCIPAATGLARRFAGTHQLCRSPPAQRDEPARHPAHSAPLGPEPALAPAVLPRSFARVGSVLIRLLADRPPRGATRRRSPRTPEHDGFGLKQSRSGSLVRNDESRPGLKQPQPIAFSWFGVPAVMRTTVRALAGPVPGGPVPARWLGDVQQRANHRCIIFTAWPWPGPAGVGP